MRVPLNCLLDTNIGSDLTRHPQGRAPGRLASEGEETVCTRVVAARELRYGAEKSGSKRLAERVNLVSSALEVLPLEVPSDLHYGEIRHPLAQHGTPLGPNDLLIAAHARALNLTVVTDNARKFPRVPNLQAENRLSD